MGSHHAFCEDVIKGDITKLKLDTSTYNEKWDLITAIDVLEHLDNEGLNYTLQLMAENGNKFLFSIPFEGDPNLEADSTHKIRETKEWWVNKLSQYFKIKDAPKDWLFNEQILIGEKNGG